MKIQLIDYNREMVAAWNVAFAGVKDIEIHQNSAFAIPTEAICSPSNSFAFFDGGFDATITEYLGSGVQINAQKKLREEYNGQLLVGQAMIIESGSKLIPYVISAPTMRVPLFLGKESVNAYLAARAIFLLLKQPNLPFNSVTIPGLGTGVGKIPYKNCAHQMRVAYDEFYLGKWKDPISWREAQIHHQKLFTFNTAVLPDLQFDQSTVTVGVKDNPYDNINIITPRDQKELGDTFDFNV